MFDADGSDREVDAAAIDPASLSEHQLLWVDQQGPPPEPLLRKLRLEAALPALKEGDGRPSLQNFGDWFLLRVVAVGRPQPLQFAGQVLTLLVGRNFVVSLHREPLDYMKQLLQRERADTRIGVLSAQSFTASLLDWQMTSYFDAVTELEEEVDRLEVQLLTQPILRERVPELAVLRRAASRLRRLLTPHRMVFGAMARPDFRPDDSEEEQAQLRMLNERFERALDAIEVARELVIGSFELFATRTAQRTNETMRVLTFVTVLLGSLSVMAGALGMNFEAPIFRTGSRGFIVTLSVMAVVVIAALLVAKRRNWW
ncbi:CorA family divalent cation transporter [Lysobacter sp. Root494]|uniref:CorA family divalent cation transporter n=1 Tax=Lysobacter sp. Root494 TaxID=1736549 RepID=UPI00138F8F33|nr:CorA family divalent cation transporter [Lysobacter sp. Root494]